MLKVYRHENGKTRLVLTFTLSRSAADRRTLDFYSSCMALGVWMTIRAFPSFYSNTCDKDNDSSLTNCSRLTH